MRTDLQQARTPGDCERTIPEADTLTQTEFGSWSDTGTRDEERAHGDSQAAPCLEGRCLQNRYIVRELIGEGAYGRVYRAEQIALNRSVAIKVIGPLGKGERDLARQFYDEAFAASRLLHPNVVSTFDYGQTEDGLLYIVMEYLPGRTLARLIKEQGPLPAERAINLVAQILGALESAHDAGVIHADLKSDNIIVQDLCGAGELIKIIDFSIARLMRGSVQSNALWRPGSRGSVRVAGTPQYMAPEVISGHAPTEKADIYAVGVLLHQLLTGVLPFSGDSHLEVMMQHLEQPVCKPSARFADLAIPPELERIIMRALSKDPDQRPDAASLRSALKAVVLVERSSCADESAEQRGHFAELMNKLRTSPVAQQTERKMMWLKRQSEQAFEEDDEDEAVELLRRAVLLAVRLGDPALIVDGYRALTDALARLGDVDTIQTELQDVLRLLQGHCPKDLWRLCMRLAKLYAVQGDEREALFTAHDALDLAQRAGCQSGCDEACAFIVELQHRWRKEYDISLARLLERDCGCAPAKPATG